MINTQKQEKHQFAAMLGELSVKDIKSILSTLRNYNADQIFIDLAELELENRK